GGGEMKREIKFRLWDDESHKWFIKGEDGLVSNMVCCDSWDMFDPDDYGWCQYTGLHDKNGREIYENDVLHTSYTYGNGETGKANLLVKYNEMSAGFIAGPYMLGKLMDIRKCEVIGNIFEDKQLLEGKQ
ncbi:YopX family protein, partial [Lacticaseibacillus paracasei]|uniref:YopX family protein n=1 Tax=Lacticaseibacillus paracasei TaxID=1597 RepID=UPI00385543C7